MYLLRWYMEWVYAVGCQPTMHHVREEYAEMVDERIFSMDWWREAGDVVHTVLRMLHPMLGIVIIPVARKHGHRHRYGKARIK